jgi:CspA family cold shock protein
MVGTVKWFNDEKGFGFIKPDSGRDVFVHYSDVVQIGSERRTLVEGQRVTFDIEEAEKGPKAVQVFPDSPADAVARAR